MDANQAQAIHTTEGPVLIVAGPGSGKTRTLVNRTTNLIVGRGVSPGAIFISTFTRKAAAELKTRIAETMREAGTGAANLNDLQVGTMDALFLGILMQYRERAGLDRGVRMLDEFEQQYLVYRHLDELLAVPFADGLWMDGSRNATTADKCAKLLTALGRVGNEALDPEALLRSGKPHAEALARVYLRYQALLRAEKAIDFALIQTKLLALLRAHPDVLAELQARYRYFMIDEYQDTNTIQEQILLLLAGERANLCVVGDDDQSIYRFRGARVQNLIDFASHFPEGRCAVIRLERNYRSHPRIVKFFSAWMDGIDWRHGRDVCRVDKSLVPAKADEGETTRVIKLAGTQGAPSWRREVLAFLRTMKNEGVIEDWNQICFLFRSVKRADVQELAEYLRSEGIPVYAPRSGLFFDRDEVRLVLGALTGLFYPFVPRAAIPQYFIDALTLLGDAVRAAADEELQDWVAAERQRWRERFPYRSLTDVFYRLMGFATFRPYAATAYDSLDRESLAVHNMAAVTQWLVRFDELEGFAAEAGAADPPDLRAGAERFFAFFSFLLEQGAGEYEDDANYAPPGFVPFMTVHQAKGLEFPVVVTGSIDKPPYGVPHPLEEELRPYYLRRVREPIDREATFDFYRLFYTAFTRAQELLVLTCIEDEGDATGRYQSPAPPFRPLYRRLAHWRDERVKLHSLRLERTKRLRLGGRYAYTTDIRLYEECPRRYMFRRVFGFGTAASESRAVRLGNLVHHTIEDIHRASLGGTSVEAADVERLLRRNAEAAGRFAGRADGREDLRGLLEEAAGHVERYVRWMAAVPARIVDAEAGVSTAENGYFLFGQLDAVFETAAGTLEIVDVKTGRRRVSSADLEEYRRQLLLYAYLLEASAGREVTGTAIYFTGEEEQPVEAIRADAAERERVVGEMKRTVDAIEARQFAVDSRNERACAGCEWRHYCSRT